ncbi:MAG TPA: GNAT family N-acetyltransferase [Tepidisphaeraceae bacterium]|nr:GNAT family N-acetyltransferase [Tepidisphaeraceae bacterium]
MTFRCVGADELDRVADTRFLCYGGAERDRARFHERLRNDARAKPGDYLLAEVDGRAVGTATSLSLKMWVRGGAIPCQGVAWVGAIKTFRRRGGGEGSPGVASAVMHEMLRMARERGDVVTALMPFRGSYYEHFGYSLVERRNEWTIPLSVLPAGPFDGVRFYEPADFTARAECLRRVNQRGQSDIERTDDVWRSFATPALDGLEVVDRPSPDGPVHGSMFFTQQHENGKDILRVVEAVYEDLPALRRQLYFLASLKDQYSAVKIALPGDLRLNWLLKETQLPHRPVNHAFATVNPITRMQLRVLNHAKFLEALHLPGDVTGSVTVAVHESEGSVSRLRIDIEGGRASVGARDGATEFECPDRVWAAVATGDLPATEALRLGLATGDMRAAGVLDVLSRGPAPWSNEYF